MKRRRVVFLFIILITSLIDLYSHPHVFMENSLIFVFEGNAFKGVKVKWVFDEMFSSMIIEDYDVNNDMKFDADEKRSVWAEAFSALKDFNYFSIIGKGNVRRKAERVTDFKPTIMKEGKLIYEFFVPYSSSSSSLSGKYYFSVVDETYYVAVESAKTGALKVVGLSENRYSVKIIKNYEKPGYDYATPPEEFLVEVK